MAEGKGTPKRQPKKRSRRGGGSVVPYASGGFRASYAYTHEGVRHRGNKVFTTRRAGWDWIEQEVARGPIAKETLGTWLTTWLKAYKGEVADSTWSRNRWSVEKYIRPRLGSLELKAVTAVRIRTFLSELAEAGVSDAERRRTGETLKLLLNAAVASDKLPRNPMTVEGKRVKLPTVIRAEWVAFTAAQLAMLLAAADLRGLGACFRLWVNTGVRVGELLGLKWGDWNPETRELIVRRAVEPRTGKLGPTKGKRTRRLPVGSSTAAALEVWRSLHKVPPTADTPLFLAGWKTRPSTGHQQHRNFFKRKWQPVLKAAGLTGQGFTPRSLRHTAATLMLQNGTSLRTVAERLGHKDPALTLRVYAHVLPGDQEAAAELLDKLTNSTQSG